MLEQKINSKTDHAGQGGNWDLSEGLRKESSGSGILQDLCMRYKQT